MSIQLNTRSALTGVQAHLATDGIVKFDLSAGVGTFNLLSVATTGIYYRVIVGDDGSNAGTNNLTINASGGDLINGLASYVVDTNGGFVTLESIDGAKWIATVTDLSDMTGVLPILKGGTGQTTAQLAINALATVGASGTYLRSNGVNDVMSTIQAADVPTLNQNTTGSAASFTGSLAGDVTGTQGATVVGRINGTSMAGLATGILKNTTGTGVPSIAVAGDFPTLNQNTTGTASNVTGTVAIANGGTGATTAETAIYNLGGIMRIVVTGINAKVTGATVLYTVPAGRTFIMIGHTSYVTAVTGAGNGWHVSIGTNVATYNNMMANTVMNAMDVLNETFRVAINGVGVGATATQVINLNVNTAATTTTMTCTAVLAGYLI